MQPIRLLKLKDSLAIIRQKAGPIQVAQSSTQPRKRLGIAEWKFQLGERKTKVFLKVWKEVYSKVEAVEGSDVARSKNFFHYDNSAMTIPIALRKWLVPEGHLSEVKEIILAHAAGKRVCYKYI